MLPIARTLHRTVDVDGVRVAYRESTPERPDAPVLLLLHGFPSGAHQFQRLIDALGAHYRLVAPDYPGFGHTQAPGDFTYTFDRIAEITTGFVQAIGLTRFVLYVFDYGAPVGLRLAERLPERIAGLVVQNGNAYDEGLSEAARAFVALRPDTLGAKESILDLLSLDGTRMQYETGVADRSQLGPDGWTLDHYFLEQPGRKDAQVALALDYHSNVERYARWQGWGDLGQVGVEREVAGVEEVQLGVGEIAEVGAGTVFGEERVADAPGDQGGRGVRAQPARSRSGWLTVAVRVRPVQVRVGPRRGREIGLPLRRRSVPADVEHTRRAPS